MGMGPILIFDKSTLQSLSVDESVWLDHFFLINLTPTFHIETLSDLAKEHKTGRKAEDVVGELAHKTPDSALPNVEFHQLVYGEALGQEIDMRFGRPIILQGKYVELGGKQGVIYIDSKENEALRRWQNKQFEEYERDIAKSWREGFTEKDMIQLYQSGRKWLEVIRRPRTLREAFDIVSASIEITKQGNLLCDCIRANGGTEKMVDAAYTRWKRSGQPPFREFAPYLAHVSHVNMFFQLAMASDLIGHHDTNNMIDMTYLFYLPFCMVFCSSDKLHDKTVPLYIKPHQTFVIGKKLKDGLSKINQHFSSLSEADKQQGLKKFAHRPPDDDSFLITRLWKKHLLPSVFDTEDKKEHVEASSQTPQDVQDFLSKAKPTSVDPNISSDDLDYFVIQNKIHKRKGSWTIVGD